jgi:hypothetical protein
VFQGESGGMTESTYTEPTTSDAGTVASDAPTPHAVDLRTAASMAGTSLAAIRGRVERGSLRYVKRDGKRLVPVSELRRAGLLDAGSDAGGGVVDAPTMSDVLDRLLDAERRATAAQVRLQLTEQAESTLTEALHRANTERAAAVERAELLAVEVEQLQAAMRSRRWRFRSRRAAGGTEKA